MGKSRFPLNVDWRTDIYNYRVASLLKKVELYKNEQTNTDEDSYSITQNVLSSVHMSATFRGKCDFLSQYLRLNDIYVPFLVANLLYIYKYLSVCQIRLGGNAIFSVPN